MIKKSNILQKSPFLLSDQSCHKTITYVVMRLVLSHRSVTRTRGVNSDCTNCDWLSPDATYRPRESLVAWTIYNRTGTSHVLLTWWMLQTFSKGYTQRYTLQTFSKGYTQRYTLQTFSKGYTHKYTLQTFSKGYTQKYTDSMSQDGSHLLLVGCIFTLIH